MKRQKKYPDTSTFHYHNENPKGRITGDCRIRAIATATGIPYNNIVLALAIIQVQTGYDQTANQGISILMDKLGWKKMPQPRHSDGTKLTGVEFCILQQALLSGDAVSEDIKPARRIFCNIGSHHEVAIVDGKVWDIWDSTGGCVGNYWIKE